MLASRSLLRLHASVAAPRIAARYSSAEAASPVVINSNPDFPAKQQFTLRVGETVSLCRCWKSTKFPKCDGTHKKLNAANGDNVGPIVVSIEPAATAASPTTN